MKKKCYIYTRVSTAAQTDGYSLNAQKERLQKFAYYKDLEIVGEYCDAGKSGHSIKGRPAFMQMMDDITSEKDGISYVLVFKLSRFGRNAADVLKSMQLLNDYDIDLVSVEDAIDSSSQGGRLTLSILSAVAEIERENISVQFMAGRMQKLASGGWPGGPVPYGYRTYEKELVIEPAEAAIVKLVYEKYLEEGMMANSVCTWLNENGYRRQIQGEEKPFTRDAVVRILENPVYCGKLYFGRRSKKKNVLIFDGKHQAIVTQEQWNAAQEKRRKTYKPRIKVDEPDRISLLSGLVKCPLCGSGMVTIKNKKANPNHGGYYKILYSYACTNHRKSVGRICEFSRIFHQEKLDNAVLEIIGQITGTEAFKKAVEDAVGAQTSVEAYEKELKELRKALHSQEHLKYKLGTQLDNLDILSADYDSEYDHIQGQIDDTYEVIGLLQEQIEKTKERLTVRRKGIHSSDNIRLILDHFDRLFQKLSFEERRELCRQLIARIEVFPEVREDGRILKEIVFRIPLFYDLRTEEDEDRPDEIVQFAFDCRKLPATVAESKATYEQIKAYVFENYGLKVPNLYIAQIKRECGIVERVNYNLPKTEGKRVPQCTEAKREAILDAFRHFRMIDQNETEEAAG